ncbi:MAG: hypothetical protein Q9164_002310 [Protoblastenia rupestris]
MDFIATQYDEDVGSTYDMINSFPTSRLEISNLKKIVISLSSAAKHNADSKQPIRALDLACGTGRFTRLLLDWCGATSVLGVDISPSMIETAKGATPPELLRSGAVDFHVADGMVPALYPGGPFDFSFGSWFHTCASNREEMLRMWETVAVNLKPGGYFVGTIPCPTEDPKEDTLRIQTARPLWKFNITHMLNKEIPDGVIQKVVIIPATGTEEDKKGLRVDLDTYHLKWSVWEEGAKQAGFKMPLGYRIPEFADELVSGNAEERKVWESLKKEPQWAFITAQKP